jgi:iron complex transport system ATP-binding protein
MSLAVEIRNLSFSYGDKRVLRGISLNVARGEMVGIIGPNGSGKTTLLKILSMVLAVHEGEVLLNEKDIQSYGRKGLSRLVAVVPQESQVSFPYTVGEIVLMGRASFQGPFALEGRRDLEVAGESMRLTETFSFADRYLHELSGGEKQRVIIARALAQEPDALLLDEPSTFLDIRHQLQIHELVWRLNHQRGFTVLSSLHDLNLAALFFPRIVMLRDGEIYRDGPPKDVLTEQIIKEVYGVKVQVHKDAAGEKPQIFLSSSPSASNL